MRLLDSSRVQDGRRVKDWPWCGRNVVVRDDVAAALEAIEAVKTETNTQKAIARAIEALFVDVSELAEVGDITRLVQTVLWEQAGIDLAGAHKTETGGAEVLNWDTDADIIEVSVLRSYGIAWDDLRYRFSYRQALSMISMVGRETPLGQALYYRSATPPKRTKYNAEEMRAFNECKRYWENRGAKAPSEEERYKAMNDATDRAFAAWCGGKR